MGSTASGGGGSCAGEQFSKNQAQIGCIAYLDDNVASRCNRFSYDGKEPMVKRKAFRIDGGEQAAQLYLHGNDSWRMHLPGDLANRPVRILAMIPR